MRFSLSPTDWFMSFLRWGYSSIVLREQQAPYETQQRTYRKIRALLAGTEIAKRTGLAAAGDLRTFAATNPARDYAFFKDLVDRVVERGERDLLFHGKPAFVGFSSGTSGSAIKSIIHERHMLKALDSWERSIGAIIAAHSNYNPLKHNRLVWGTTPPPITRSAAGIDQGYYCSFMADHRIPLLANHTFPTPEVGRITDMKEKVKAAARELRNTPIHLASALPSYLLTLLEELRAHWGVRDLGEVWPELDVILYSGTYIDPYRAQLTQLLGHPVTFIGMYLATEGPIGYEIPSLSGGASGLFAFHLSSLVFTFRKLDGDDRVLTVADLSPGDEVELLLTAPNGFINYRIGDCLRIHSTQPLLFEIAGRVGHGLNLCGEKMSLGELNQAAAKANAVLSAPMRHYFVCPGTSASGRSCYMWTLLVDNPESVPKDAVIAALDDALVQMNQEYKVHRQDLGLLDAPRINLLHSSVAKKYFDRDSHRGQLKMKTAFDSADKLQQFLAGLDIESRPGAS